MAGNARPTTLIRSGALELGACVGAAVALGAYRLLALRGGAVGHREDAVALAAAACVVVAVHVRDYLAPRPRWSAIAGGALAGAALALLVARVLASPFTSQRLHRWNLPGLSIALPAPQRELGGTYASGLVQVSRPGISAIAFWAPGPIGDADHLGAMAAGALRSGGEKVTITPRSFAAGALETASIAATTASTSAYFTDVACGRRVLVVETFADRDLDLAAVHGRIVRSVACMPDAAEDVRLAQPPIEIDVPAGWSVIATPDAPPGWQGPQATIRVVETPRVDLDQQLPGLRELLVKEVGPITFTGPVAIGDRVGQVGRFELEGHAGEAVVLPIDCGPRRFLAIAFSVAADADARAALATARCDDGAAPSVAP